jgi:TatD DNase family protein
MLIDSHCHLDFPELSSDLEAVLARAKSEGVGYIINIGASLEGSIRSLELAAKYDFIFASVGLHPHEADKFNQDIENELSILAAKEKVVAIGEAGLDYYKNYSAIENQRVLFKAMLRLAKEKNLPLVIHSREAQADTLKILKEEAIKKAVVHCFSGDELFLRQCLDAGFFISFTCNITYKKAQGLRDLIVKMPLERLMLETDAPFLAPEGLRGRRNEPGNVKILAQEISRLRGVSLEEISEITSQNTINFFSLK